MSGYVPGSTANLPTGAAERLRAMRGTGDRPAFFTSDLSVDEFLLVEQAGFEALGLVLGSSIYHVGFQWQKWSVSQELPVLTRAMYEARELAMTRMEEEADLLGADGVVGAEQVRLLLHPRHGELTRLVHGAGEDRKLLAHAPLLPLEADVIDGGAEHEAEGLEPCLLDEQELVDREVAGKECGPIPGPAHGAETLCRAGWQVGGRTRHIAAHACSCR